MLEKNLCRRLLEVTIEKKVVAIKVQDEEKEVICPHSDSAYKRPSSGFAETSDAAVPQKRPGFIPGA